MRLPDSTFAWQKTVASGQLDLSNTQTYYNTYSAYLINVGPQHASVDFKIDFLTPGSLNCTYRVQGGPVVIVAKPMVTGLYYTLPLASLPSATDGLLITVTSSLDLPAYKFFIQRWPADIMSLKFYPTEPSFTPAYVAGGVRCFTATYDMATYSQVQIMASFIQGQPLDETGSGGDELGREGRKRGKQQAASRMRAASNRKAASSGSSTQPAVCGHPPHPFALCMALCFCVL
jgi:hypothetical protein